MGSDTVLLEELPEVPVVEINQEGREDRVGCYQEETVEQETLEVEREGSEGGCVFL